MESTAYVDYGRGNVKFEFNILKEEDKYITMHGSIKMPACDKFEQATQKLSEWFIDNIQQNQDIIDMQKNNNNLINNHSNMKGNTMDNDKDYYGVCFSQYRGKLVCITKDKTEAEQVLKQYKLKAKIIIIKDGEEIKTAFEQGKNIYNYSENDKVELEVHSYPSSKYRKDEFFAEAFRDNEVPKYIKKISMDICTKFEINGTSDPMYISNITALELGLGNGMSEFIDKAPKTIYSDLDEKIDKLSKRLTHAYRTSILESMHTTEEGKKEICKIINKNLDKIRNKNYEL